MVAAVRKTRRNSPKKPQSVLSRNKMLWAILVIVLIVIIGSLIGLVKLKNNQAAQKESVKKEQVVEKPVPPKANYSYTQLLENKKIDTGSGIVNDRNYEAERQAQDAAYYKRIAEKRQKIAEEKARKEQLRELQLEKARLAKERARLEKERKAQAAVANKATQSGNSQTSEMIVSKAGNEVIVLNDKREANKVYLYCTSNFRTEKEAEAEKARLALLGFQSFVYRKKMGGSFVYSLAVGPYDKANKAATTKKFATTTGRSCS